MLKDFVLELANNPGTSATVNLAGVPVGSSRVTFGSVFSTGAAVFYVMDDGTQFELGEGVFTAGSPDTLTRTTVRTNSAGTTARLNFTGSVHVYNALPSLRTIYYDGTGGLASNLILNNSIAVAGKETGGTQRSLLFVDGSNALTMQAAGSGWRVTNAAFTDNNLLMDDSGNLVVRGALDAPSVTASGAISGAALTASGAATLSSTLGVSGAVTLSSTLSVADDLIALDLFVSNNQMRANTVNTAAAMIVLSYFSGVVGSISTDGTATAYNTTSDYRLKVTFGLSDGTLILSIPIYDAEFKALPGVRRPMALAHEVAEVAPWAVRGEKDVVDGEGAIVPQQVDYPSLIPAMIATIQRLEARVAALEAA